MLLSLVTALAMVPEACSLSTADQAWVDRAVDAWRFSCKEISGIKDITKFQVLFFDEKCSLTSDNALTSESSASVKWESKAFEGEVTLPNGDKMPPVITSFASGEKDFTYFVMSTPSVWRKGGLDKGGPIDLESTMVAVMLHEASHVAQIGPYGKRLGKMIQDNKLPDDFSDDSLQKKFRTNKEFSDSVAKETELFLAATAARDDAVARSKAREARDMMLARQKKWLVGADAYWVEAENIWGTFEGAGQYVGYQWLIHPKGGAFPVEPVMERFGKGAGWWSQSEGFAIVMSLERLMGPGWKKHAFGDGKYTVLEMLDRELGIQY
jgi:hypothetical protein